MIAASVLCVLFGNGTHLHTVFDHFSEHSDIHIYVHAHPADASHGHTPEFDDNETHLHPTATVELEGRLTQKQYTNINLLLMRTLLRKPEKFQTLIA